jgi:RNA polymerase sigma-70 factor (ECF subfamily)
VASSPRSQVAEATPSFEDTFERFAPFVWRVVRRLGVPAPDVPDVCQEVFLVVHRKLPAFQGASSLKTWLYAICVRVVSGYRRRGYRSKEETVAVLPEESTRPTQDGDLERRRAREHLWRILEALGAEKRDVFVLYELEELSMPEVAELVGCPLTTAYSRLHAARKAVKASFARRDLGRRAP